MHRQAALGFTFAVVLLAASLGAALPTVDPGAASAQPLWTTALAAREPAGVSVNLLGEAFAAANADGRGAVTELDPLGAPAWTWRAGGPIGAVAAWPDTGAFVVSDTLGQGVDLLVTALDTQGDVAWQKVLATPAEEHARAAAADARGATLAGRSGRDGLVARFSSDGTLAWSQRIATPSETRLEAVALAADGGAVLAGWTYDGLRNRLLVERLDAAGDPQWQRILTWSGASVRGEAVAVDALGRIAVAGVWANGAVQKPLVAAFDSGGALRWWRTLEGFPQGAASGVALDALGGLEVAGTTAASGGAHAWFLAKLSSAGNLLQAQPLGVSGAAEGLAFARSPAGMLTLVGAAGDHVAAARFLDPLGAGAVP